VGENVGQKSTEESRIEIIEVNLEKIETSVLLIFELKTRCISENILNSFFLQISFTLTISPCAKEVL